MKKIYAYAHTHWDREWYQPFETFRTYLVFVLRQILDDLEAGKLPRFYLDGQSVILEDALEIAPELAPRIGSLMQQGLLAAGPWYVLPDEMLVCGESLVRNLKTGIACVRKYGTPAMVGYSPDTFGHTQDLPRVLCGFGINSAFLWRGVPALSFGPCFWWRSPDGSQVLAYQLCRGYYQTSLIEKTLGGFSNGALDEYVEELSQFAGDRRQWEDPKLYDKTPDAVLCPIGGDHTAPPRNLTEIMRLLNLKLKAKNLELSTVQLSEFVELLEEQAKAPHTLVGVVAKELRDNTASKQYGNAYLLPGVLSSRLYLKRENREAERRLFRFCEPLFSLLAMRGLADYPQAELTHALRLLLKNHPHDSICGCSVDAVHDEMLTRFACIHQIIDPLLENAKWKLAALPDSSPMVADDPAAGLKRLRLINPSGRNFSGPVLLNWFVLPGATDEHAEGSVQLLESESSDQLFAGWGRVPYYTMLESKRGLVWVDDLPAFGELNQSWPRAETVESKWPPARLRAKALDNGILNVSLNEQGHVSVVWTDSDGGQRAYELKHILRDTADGGDTYNYDPVPGDKAIEAKLVSVFPGKKGPLLSSLLLKYEIKMPESLLEDKSGAANANVAVNANATVNVNAAANANRPSLPLFKRSSKKLVCQIETEIILKRASRILEFETSFINQASGHRLEALLSTGYPVHCSFSENHFSLVKRYHQTKGHNQVTLPVEAGCEAPCDRFPAQRFLISNGQIVLNKGLPEYGADGDAISLTLLRSVSLLSRGRMQSRGGGAGPHLAVPGAECKGLNRVSYAWSPLSLFQKRTVLADSLADESIVEAYDLAEAYEQEIFSAFSSQENTATKSLLRCDHASVRFLGAYVSNEQDEIYVRLQNVSNEIIGTKVLIEFDFQSAHLCRLDEEVGEQVFLYREYIKTDSGSIAEREVCALDINFVANELKTIKFHLKGAAHEQAPAAARTRKRRSSSRTG